MERRLCRPKPPEGHALPRHLVAPLPPRVYALPELGPRRQFSRWPAGHDEAWPFRASLVADEPLAGE